MLYYLLYSLSIFLVWAYAFLYGGQPSNYSILLGLLYTFYASYYIRQLIKGSETKWHILLKLFAPLLYFGLYIYTLKERGYSWMPLLNSPLMAATLLTLGIQFDRRLFPKQAMQFFVLTGIIIYSFRFYPEHIELSKYEHHQQQPSYNFAEKKAEEPKRDSSYNIFSQFFWQEEGDTVTLAQNGHYVLIETWHERCPPCLKAIPDMQPFYQELKGKLDQYYIYVPIDKMAELNQNKVFNFEKIKEHERIRIDLGLQQQLGLKGFPYFLLFNPQGELIFEQRGYNEEKRLELEALIREKIL